MRIAWCAAEGAGRGDRRDGSRYRLRLVAHDPIAYDLYYHVVANPALWFVQHGLWELKHEPEQRPPPGLGRGVCLGQPGIRRRSRRGAGPRSGHGRLLPRLPPVPGAERSCASGWPDTVIAHFTHIPWVDPDGWSRAAGRDRQGDPREPALRSTSSASTRIAGGERVPVDVRRAMRASTPASTLVTAHPILDRPGRVHGARASPPVLERERDLPRAANPRR